MLVSYLILYLKYVSDVMWEKELDFLKVQNEYISIIYKKDIFSGFYKVINQMNF